MRQSSQEHYLQATEQHLPTPPLPQAKGTYPPAVFLTGPLVTEV